MNRITVILGFFFFTVITVRAESLPNYQIQTSPQYDALFERTDGWTGADGAYTVALDATTTIWLFSDTWVGKIRDGKHVDSTMINNSVGLQKGTNPADASVEFFYHTKNNKPASLIEPIDGRGWYWLFDGVMTPQGLYLFLMQTIKTGEAVFGFAHAATWLGHVTNPHSRPTQWKIEQTKIPWDRASQKGNMHFGSAVLNKDGTVYIYGIDEEKRGDWLHRYMILARVPERQIGDFQAWRFYDKGEWITDYRNAERLCGKVGSEFSVSYQPDLDQYILLTTENGMSENIQIRSAGHPWGPWSQPVTVFECPDSKWHSSYFTYAGKAHPMLSHPNELLFTYVCNSFDFFQMVSDARIYHPRFVRIQFNPSNHLQREIEK